MGTDCEASGFLNYRAKYLHAPCAPPSPLYCHVSYWMASFFLRLCLSHRQHVVVETRQSRPQVKVIIPHGKTVLVHEQWSAAFRTLSAGQLQVGRSVTQEQQHALAAPVSHVTVMVTHPSFLPSFPEALMCHVHGEHFADSCCLMVPLMMVFPHLFFLRRFFNQVTVDRVAQNGPGPH